MASALRYPIPLQDALPGWRKRLMERLPLQADSPESYRIHYYDSFDWRLFRCGTALKWEQRYGESRCYLYKLDGGAGIASLPRSEPPLKFAADLPAGRLRQRLSARLGVRALLPLATLEVRSHHLRLKDPEGKTRLRLFLEQHRLRGYLVRVEAADGWQWRSSLSRADTGAGACELVLLEALL